MKSNGPFPLDSVADQNYANQKFNCILLYQLPGTQAYYLPREIPRTWRYLVISSGHSTKFLIQFSEKIKEIQINNSEIMISFNVAALLASVEPKLAEDTLTTVAKIHKTNWAQTSFRGAKAHYNTE